VAYQMTPKPMILRDLETESHFSCLKPDSHTSENVARINCDMFTHESENIRGMYFQLSFWNFRISQGHGSQSRNISKLVQKIAALLVQTA